MGLFTNIIWIIATFILFLGLFALLLSPFEENKSGVGLSTLLALVALLLAVFVSISAHTWVEEQGGVSEALGLGVSKVVKPVSQEVEKQVEKFKEGFNR